MRILLVVDEIRDDQWKCLKVTVRSGLLHLFATPRRDAAGIAFDPARRWIEVTDLLPGTYDVTVGWPGVSTQSHRIEVRSGVEHEIRLEPKGGRRQQFSVRAPRALAADEELTVIFSSGSTGDPKGVRLSHHNVLSNIEGLRMVFRVKEVDRQRNFTRYFWKATPAN